LKRLWIRRILSGAGLTADGELVSGKKDPIWFLPVGYAGDTPEASLRRAPKDIEVLHFGKLTPHRIGILESITANGVDLTAIWTRVQLGSGTGIYDAFVDQDARRSALI